jgi:hypothetical protein
MICVASRYQATAHEAIAPFDASIVLLRARKTRPNSQPVLIASYKIFLS